MVKTYTELYVEAITPLTRSYLINVNGDLIASFHHIAQPFMKEIALKRKEKDQRGKRKHDPRLMADLIEARKQAKKEKIAKLLTKRKNRS